MTAPSLTGLTAPTFAENTVNATPQVIDSDVTFTDPDNNFNGGTLTVSGLLAEDTVSILTGAVIYRVGADVFYDADGAGGGAAVIIGSAAGGAGATFTVTFNASATSAIVELVIESLTYANSSDTPAAARALSIVIVDAAGQSSALASFALLAPASNPFTGIDVGTQSRPAFADLDGDGDLDLVVGAFDGNIYTYLNTAGVFAEVTGGSNPFDTIDVGFYAVPTFVDIDGDTDLDLVVGENAGLLLTYENNGGVFTQLIGAANPFNGYDTHLTSPTFTDIDGDGDMDAVVGNYDGTISVLQNNANVFTLLAGGANPFNGIDVGFGAAPVFVDVDQDGDLDLLAGSANLATISTFRNDGGVFTELTGSNNPFNGIAVGNNPTPVLFDVDGDGDADIVMGGINGELAIYTHVPATGQSSITVNVTAQTEGPTALADNLVGTAGADTISALAGVDVVDGGGNDTLDGGEGDDTLIGGTGNDYLRGGVGVDAMAGGTGDDTYVVDDAGDTTDETGGDGTDLVISRISWTLGAGLENLTLGGAGVNLNGTGNGLANVLTGNSFANTLGGLAGNDTLNGGGGDDVLNGGDDDDTLDGGTQNDTLNGGAGTDTLNGGAGHDALDGGTGADAMTGGAGNDTYVVDDAGDTVTEGAAGGTDTVLASFGYNLTANVENLTLTGSGNINGGGNALANTITGNSGGNSLFGGNGGDTLNGLAGNDFLLGQGGNDALDGGADNDVLVGGAGQDRLTGGTGADRFAFTGDDIRRSGPGFGLASDKDQILDLSFAANDWIDLSDIDANVNLANDQAFTFVGAFTGAAGQATMKFAGGKTLLQLDVDGDGKADLRIEINGNLTGTTTNLYTGGGDTDGGWVL